jgi:hypothetical protein
VRGNRQAFEHQSSEVGEEPAESITLLRGIDHDDVKEDASAPNRVSGGSAGGPQNGKRLYPKFKLLRER